MKKHMEKWPNLFIVGAPKAGTSSLYAYLKDIPEIYMSPIKEPHYFSRSTIPDDSPFKPIREKKKYLNLFKDRKNEKIVGEASPSYLIDPEAPKLIFQIVPQAFIIISLRDPVERVISEYFMFNRLGILKSSFHDELKKSLNKNFDLDGPRLGLQRSLYYENVKRYLQIFGKKQVKILIFENFISNPKKTVEDILKFVHLETLLKNFSSEPYNQFAVPRGPLAQIIYQNRTIRKITEKLLYPSQRKFLKEIFILKKVPKPKIELEDRRILIDYFQEDVQKLKDLLKTELPWKNFGSSYKN